MLGARVNAVSRDAGIVRDHAWPDHLGACEREWKPYLDGEREFDAAIRALSTCWRLIRSDNASVKLGSRSAISFLSS